MNKLKRLVERLERLAKTLFFAKREDYGKSGTDVARKGEDVLRLLAQGRVAQACELWARTNPRQRSRHGWTKNPLDSWRFTATPVVKDLFEDLAGFSGHGREWVRVGDEILTVAAQMMLEFGGFQPPAPAELERGLSGAKSYLARLRIALHQLRAKKRNNYKHLDAQ